ncbi:MAG: GntR family transcriptional regulator [Firmicutes bacterium]|nr:GntR family transcriptional regulator [Bacillota bacterium]
MLELDLRSRLPIYEQLVDKCKELIITKVLEADQQLPSVRTLAKQLSINPNTIQKAYRELERQGYIYSVKGRGSFVTPSVQVSNTEKIVKLKKQLMKIISELTYLGIKKEDVLNMISETQVEDKGGKKID